MRNKPWIIILICILVGCSDQKIIEELAFVRTVTYDSIEGVNPKDKVRITYTIPMAEKKKHIVFTTETKTSKQARVIFSRQNDRTLVSGQLRQVIFGKDLAKQGIWWHMDSLLRDPTIGRKVFIVMADGVGHDIINREYIQDPSAGEYINDMLERATTLTDIPTSNLHTFSRDYYDYGIDPVMPILKLEKDMIRISGIAFFQDDRYVTGIDQKQNLIFTALRDNLHTGELSLNILEQKDGTQDAVILGYVESDRQVKVSKKGPIENGRNIHVNIDMKLTGSLLDYTGRLDLSIAKNQEKLENIMEQHIKKEAELIIKKTQKYKVDPIGIGQYVRNSMPYEDWMKLKWHDVYSNINVNVNVKVKIKEYGKMQ